MMLNDPKLLRLGATVFRKTLHPAPRMNPRMTERDIRNPSLLMGVFPAVELMRSTSILDILVCLVERKRKDHLRLPFYSNNLTLSHCILTIAPVTTNIRVPVT